ncbi:MAG: hypothetical protein ACRDP7_12855 [Trebonia sp.]
MMDDRGWGWSNRDIRLCLLIEWIADSPAVDGVVISPEEFYNSLADQGMNTWDVAHADVKHLQSRAMIKLSVAMGGIPGLHIYQVQGARDFAEEIRAHRADKRRRRQACRDAIVDWLASVDAVDGKVQVLSNMMTAPRWGTWFAEPFSAAEIADAADWLHTNGLTECAAVAGNPAPMFAFLTEAGAMCVDEFGAHADQYVAWRRQAQAETQGQVPGSGPTISIGIAHGPIQVAGNNSRQVQVAAQASPEDLRQAISTVAQLVRGAVPDVLDADEQEQAALAALGTDGADEGALRRFGDWAVSTVKAGTNGAMVAAVSSSVTYLLTQAAYVAGHLPAGQHLPF